MQREPPVAWEAQREKGARGIQALSLGGCGKAHPVVAQVIDGVVGPEEDVPKDRSFILNRVKPASHLHA